MFRGRSATAAATARPGAGAFSSLSIRTRLTALGALTMLLVLVAAGRWGMRAGTEQHQGLSQVSHAVQQLDEMTQQYAALVEQSAAAAESLKGQAFGLTEVVDVVRLRDEIGSAAAGPEGAGR